MSSSRKCTECDTVITGRATTCSARCRAKRSRRIKRNKANGADALNAARALGVEREELESQATDIIVRELTPVVREAITEDVVNAIGAMVRLTPKAIALLERDLESSDAVLRQRAYTLLMKYTIGNPAVAPQPEFNPPDVKVNFTMPRPEYVTQGEQEQPVDAEVVEEQPMQLCMACDTMKPLDEFVPDTPRCLDCHERLMARKAAILGSDA
jgi:hypothetical protein